MLKYCVQYWDEKKTTKLEEFWLLDGKYHREEGPAYICYYSNGSIELKEYYIIGNKHREDGPAYIGYNADGSVSYALYYLNGELYTEEDWFNALPTQSKVDYLLKSEQNVFSRAQSIKS